MAAARPASVGRVCLVSVDAGPAPTSQLSMAPVATEKKVDGRANNGAHLKLKKGFKPRTKKAREQARIAAGGKKRGRKPGTKNAPKKA